MFEPDLLHGHGEIGVLKTFKELKNVLGGSWELSGVPRNCREIGGGFREDQLSDEAYEHRKEFQGHHKAFRKSLKGF